MAPKTEKRQIRKGKERRNSLPRLFFEIFSEFLHPIGGNRDYAHVRELPIVLPRCYLWRFRLFLRGFEFFFNVLHLRQ